MAKILRLPFWRLALIFDRGTASFFPGGLKWATNLSAKHYRDGVLLAEYDFGSGKVTNDGVQNLAQDWTLTSVGLGAKAAPTFGANSASGGHMSNGTYNYRVTALTSVGESTGTSASVVLAAGGALQTQVINWALTGGAIGYKVYRTIAGGGGGTEKWVGTVASGATTTFTDSVADSTQATGYAVPTSDTSNYAALRAANWHDTGTDTTADAASDFKLNTAVTTSARGQGTQTNPIAGQYQSVASISYTSTLALTEWGIFNHNRAVGDTAISGLRPTLWDRRQFAAVNVNASDTIQWTYQLTVVAGG